MTLGLILRTVIKVRVGLKVTKNIDLEMFLEGAELDPED